MSDVFYLRSIDPPVSRDDVPAMLRLVGDCFRMHRVDWSASFLADDGRRMMCWYRAPDAESARVALRQVGSDMNAVWAGRVLDADAAVHPIEAANFVAEIPLAGRMDHVELLRKPAAETDTALVRGFASLDGRRLVALFRGDDAECIGAAFSQAGVDDATLWRCTTIAPGQLRVPVR